MMNGKIFRDKDRASEVLTIKLQSRNTSGHLEHFLTTIVCVQWRYTKRRTDMNKDRQTHLIDVSDVDIYIGGTEQSHPQKSVKGPQWARRRTITSSWTGRWLRSPTTEIQTTNTSSWLRTSWHGPDWLSYMCHRCWLYLYEGVTKPEAGSWE